MFPVPNDGSNTAESGSIQNYRHNARTSSRPHFDSQCIDWSLWLWSTSFPRPFQQTIVSILNPPSNRPNAKHWNQNYFWHTTNRESSHYDDGLDNGVVVIYIPQSHRVHGVSPIAMVNIHSHIDIECHIDGDCLVPRAMSTTLPRHRNHQSVPL